MSFEQDLIEHSEVEIRILKHAMMKPCKSQKVAPSAADRWMYDVCWAGDTAAQKQWIRFPPGRKCQTFLHCINRRLTGREWEDEIEDRNPPPWGHNGQRGLPPLSARLPFFVSLSPEHTEDRASAASQFRKQHEQKVAAMVSEPHVFCCTCYQMTLKEPQWTFFTILSWAQDICSAAVTWLLMHLNQWPSSVQHHGSSGHNFC